MTGGLLQLVAKGSENIFLNYEPHMTFFKQVYRRHTNFSRGEFDLGFDTKLDFGKIARCKIQRFGDLVHRMFLKIKLPQIDMFFKKITNKNVVELLEQFNIKWNPSEPLSNIFDEESYNEVSIIIDETLIQVTSELEVIDKILPEFQIGGNLTATQFFINYPTATEDDVELYFDFVMDYLMECDQYNITYKCIDAGYDDIITPLPLINLTILKNEIFSLIIEFLTGESVPDSCNDENILFMINLLIADYNVQYHTGDLSAESLFKTAIQNAYGSNESYKETDAYKIFDYILKNRYNVVTDIQPNDTDIIQSILDDLFNSILFDLPRNLRLLEQIYDSFNNDYSFTFYKDYTFITTDTYSAGTFINTSLINSTVPEFQDNFTKDFQITPTPGEPIDLIHPYEIYVNDAVNQFNINNQNIFRNDLYNNYFEDFDLLWSRLNLGELGVQCPPVDLGYLPPYENPRPFPILDPGRTCLDFELQGMISDVNAIYNPTVNTNLFNMQTLHLIPMFVANDIHMALLRYAMKEVETLKFTNLVSAEAYSFATRIFDLEDGYWTGGEGIAPLYNSYMWNGSNLETITQFLGREDITVLGTSYLLVPQLTPLGQAIPPSIDNLTQSIKLSEYGVPSFGTGTPEYNLDTARLTIQANPVLNKYTYNFNTEITNRIDGTFLWLDLEEEVRIKMIGFYYNSIIGPIIQIFEQVVREIIRDLTDPTSQLYNYIVSKNYTTEALKISEIVRGNNINDIIQFAIIRDGLTTDSRDIKEKLVEFVTLGSPVIIGNKEGYETYYADAIEQLYLDGTPAFVNIMDYIVDYYKTNYKSKQAVNSGSVEYYWVDGTSIGEYIDELKTKLFDPYDNFGTNINQFITSVSVFSNASQTFPPPPSFTTPIFVPFAKEIIEKFQADVEGIINLFVTPNEDIPSLAIYKGNGMNIRNDLRINNQSYINLIDTQVYESEGDSNIQQWGNPAPDPLNAFNVNDILFDVVSSIWYNITKSFIDSYNSLYADTLLSNPYASEFIGCEIVNCITNINNTDYIINISTEASENYIINVHYIINDVINTSSYAGIYYYALFFAEFFDFFGPYTYVYRVSPYYILPSVQQVFPNIHSSITDKQNILNSLLANLTNNLELLKVKSLTLSYPEYYYEQYLIVLNALINEIETRLNPDLTLFYGHSNHTDPPANPTADPILLILEQLTASPMDPLTEPRNGTMDIVLDSSDNCDLLFNSIVNPFSPINNPNLHNLWNSIWLPSQQFDSAEETAKHNLLFGNVDAPYLYSMKTLIDTNFGQFLTEDEVYLFLKYIVIRNSIFKPLLNLIAITVTETYNNFLDYYETAKRENQKTKDAIDNGLKETLEKTLSASVKAKFAWVKRIGHYLIDYVLVKIGDQQIDKHTGEWLELWNDLTRDKKTKGKAYNFMIGDISVLTNFDANSKPSYELLIPLQFWFNRHMNSAISLINLQHSGVSIEIKLRELREVALFESFDLTTFRTTPKLDCKLLTEYIYLEESERNTMATKRIEYLSDGIQNNGNFIVGKKTMELAIERSGLGVPEIDVELRMTNPTKEFIFVVQDMSFIDGSKPFGERQYNNYTDGTKTMINRIGIKFNRREREIMKDDIYYNYIQPQQHHTSTPSDGVYVYSMSIEPEKFQPSGSANLSKLEDVIITFEFKSYIIEQILNGTKEYRIAVYANSYNILRVVSGMSGLMFM